MPKSIGLALGSGGARGWAHIGVLRALEAAQIPIHCIAGSSIGAFVGAIYAADALDNLEAFVDDIDWRTILALLDVDFPSQGLLDGHKVYNLLFSHLNEARIETATLPFACVATDLQQQRAVILREGLMVDAVRASISIPGIFNPFEKAGRFYIDGGVVNPVPVDVARDLGADIVIAVNLNHASLDQNLATDKAPATTATGASPSQSEPSPRQRHTPATAERHQLMANLKHRYEAVQETLAAKLDRWFPTEAAGPNIFDVIGNAINIMEQQVTRVRLEIDPPDILLQPDLSEFGIFDFHRGDALMELGYECVQPHLDDIRHRLAT